MDDKKMDELKKRAASLGVAATLAATGLSGAAMKAGEKELTSNIGYVQEVDDDFDIEKSAVVSDVEKSAVVSGVDDKLSVEPTVTAYDIPAVTTTSFTEGVASTVQTSAVGNVNVNMSTVTIPASNKPTVTSKTIEAGVRDQKSIDYECYSLMQDANAYALGRFSSKFSSLSEALESNGIKLSAEQKARYDTIIADTYEVYKKGIASYEAGDMEGFRKVCDDVLNSKKYLNLDDLVDIIALNINIQGDYIKNSDNYSIKDGKLIIDGYTVDGLLTSPNYVDNTDLMSLIKFYGNTSGNDRLVLDIMQVPIFVTKQVVSPTNYTLVNNNSVYAYNSETFKDKIKSIKDYYCSVTGVTNFYTDYVDGKYVLKGRDQDSKEVNLSNSAFNAEVQQYLEYYYQALRADRSKVGYFDGAQMKNFLAQYDNNNTNIKVSSVNRDLGMDEYNCYNLMLDGIGFVLNGYERSHGSLSETLEGTYNVQLSLEQKARYDTIVEDTHNAYQRGIDAYESGHVSEFKKVCDEFVKEKKYFNLDDVVDIVSINLNSQGEQKLIKNSKNYSISDDKLIIDGITVEKLIPDDYDCVLSYTALYNDADDLDIKTLDIMRVTSEAIKESINPTCFSIMTDGTYYGYSNKVLKNKISEIEQFFENSTGLNNLGYEKAGAEVVFYGFDESGNKQIVSNDNEDIKALSRYLTTYKNELNSAANSRVGNFDGAMVRDYLQEYSTIGRNMSR